VKRALLVVVIAACAPAARPSSFDPATFKPEWPVVAGVRKPWADRPGEPGPAKPTAEGMRLRAVFRDVEAGRYSAVRLRYRAAIYGDGTVALPCADVPDGWILHASGVRPLLEDVRAAIDAHGSDEARGEPSVTLEDGAQIPERLVRSRCSHASAATITLIEDGAARTVSWGGCGSGGVAPPEAVPRLLNRTLAAPCR
jgi:hypothetical protein